MYERKRLLFLRHKKSCNDGHSKVIVAKEERIKYEKLFDR